MDWIEILNGFNKSVRQDNKMYDWMAGSKPPSASTAMQGGLNALNLFKQKDNLNTLSSVFKTTGNATPGAGMFGFANDALIGAAKNTGSTGVGSFLKGFSKGAGGLTNVGNVALGIANSIPGVKAENNDGFGKGLDIASSALGLGASLGFTALGPIGFAVGAASLINNIAGKRAKEQGIDANALNSTGAGYSGLSQDVGNAGTKTTLTGNLFGYKGNRTKNINSKIDLLDSRRATAATIGNTNTKNTTAASNTTQDIINKNRQALSGGQNTSILSAKKGTKLSKLKTISAKAKRNVIPSGALHARKNNLPEEIAKDTTNKGIPVVSSKEDGGLIQHAEIEHSEIIFNKDVTNRIEALWKKFKEGDENATLEAGKFLTYEILENTDDNTNLINTIQ